jgi:hypothetical protein
MQMATRHYQYVQPLEGLGTGYFVHKVAVRVILVWLTRYLQQFCTHRSI